MDLSERVELELLFFAMAEHQNRYTKVTWKPKPKVENGTSKEDPSRKVLT